MPKVGEIRAGSEIGRSVGQKYIWASCENCGEWRWVTVVKGKPISCKCHACAVKEKNGARVGSLNPHWKGGRHKIRAGYVLVRVSPNSPFQQMCDYRGYVYEHRLVVAQALGRCLELWEVVHHKDGCEKDDNRYPETLTLLQVDQHNLLAILPRKIKRLERKVARQGKEIRLLQWHIQNLNRSRQASNAHNSLSD